MSYEESYVGSLRQLVGDRRLITPGPRAVITDNHDRLLFIRRSDNGAWAMPAGGMELGESSRTPRSARSARKPA
ncbi:hypothetical protein GCM10028864_14760 [Microlunatus parietis]